MKAAESSWKQEFEVKILDIVDRRIESKILENLPELRNNLVAASKVSPTVDNNMSGSYRKNLIVTCVPVSDGEDVVVIIKKLAKQINFTQSQFIDNCFRVEKKGHQGAQTNPPAILFKLTTELARDGFLRCYFSHIKKHKLIPPDIGIEGSQRIYVNEHMNPSLQPVLKAAVAIRKSGVIGQVASHSSYLSVKSNSKWYRIFSEEDLKELVEQLRNESFDRSSY